MYADRYAQGRSLKPGSLALAMGLTALPIVGLVLSTGVTRLIKLADPPLITENLPLPPPPPQPQPKPRPEAKAPTTEKVFTTAPKIEVPVLHPIDTTDILPPPPQPTQPGTGTGTVVDTGTPPVVPPKLVDAIIDGRYADAFQPPYPASEVRAGREGRVVVRVLIGADGRVKRVERVSAASDAFFAAVERQALTRWRFKPATRDGVAMEQWKQMSLRFELDSQ